MRRMCESLIQMKIQECLNYRGIFCIELWAYVIDLIINFPIVLCTQTGFKAQSFSGFHRSNLYNYCLNKELLQFLALFLPPPPPPCTRCQRRIPRGDTWPLFKVSWWFGWRPALLPVTYPFQVSLSKWIIVHPFNFIEQITFVKVYLCK